MDIRAYGRTGVRVFGRSGVRAYGCTQAEIIMGYGIIEVKFILCTNIMRLQFESLI